MIQYPHVRRFLLALEFAMHGMFVKLECSRVIFVTSLWKMHVIVCSGMFLKNLSATMHMTSFSEVKSWISPEFFTAEQFCIFEKILFQQKVSRYARVQYTKKFTQFSPMLVTMMREGNKNSKLPKTFHKRSEGKSNFMQCMCAKKDLKFKTKER